MGAELIETPALIVVAAAAAGFGALLLLLHWRSTPRPTKWTLDHVDGRGRLVVLVHGLSGVASFRAVVDLAREALPDSDLLVFDYDSRPLSNASPYAIANAIERQINDHHEANHYHEIVLVGHSMGGMLLRKAVVWAAGIEEDRNEFGRRGERQWLGCVSRFVSLATINRGWSIEPRPAQMRVLVALAYSVLGRLVRLSRSGGLILALQRGSPFVADARVQWIALCRGSKGARKIPQTIHLLGDKDDIVNRDDSMDLNAAKDTIFVTLQDTGHRDIGTLARGGDGREDRDRRDKVRLALQGQLDRLDIDHAVTLREDPDVRRIIYIMHGIRDYGEWTDKLRVTIEETAALHGEASAVVNQKYGHFPMLPFLLYWDRQKKVRLFMDEYTENRARFPQASQFDFIGHSNGTYILASALQRYKTLSVHRVCVAGSVVPKHYAWRDLLDRGRVKHVANIVAAGDWVVAIFPRLFEQIADWWGVKPLLGALDIGSGGFRGFQDAVDPTKRVENVQFAAGGHGTAVDPRNRDKLEAIARYVVLGDTSGFTIFRSSDLPERWLAALSNVCWLVWAVGLLVISFVGVTAFGFGLWVGWLYIAVLVGLLYSV